MNNIKKNKIKALDNLRFRNEILCQAIHKCERDNSLFELFKDAEYLIKYKSSRDTMGETGYELFMQISQKATYVKNMIEVANFLDKIGSYFLSEPNEDDYYRVQLKQRLKYCKSILVKLRPVMLEQTKDWTLERKQMDLNNPDVNQFFGEWYIS